MIIILWKIYFWAMLSYTLVQWGICLARHGEEIEINGYHQLIHLLLWIPAFVIMFYTIFK